MRFSSLVFAEAPDYVFEGWGYDASQTGDARFIKPIAPDGWHYDDVNGTFYPDAEPTPVPTLAEQIADQQELAVDHEYRITLLELGVTEDAV